MKRTYSSICYGFLAVATIFASAAFALPASAVEYADSGEITLDADVTDGIVVKSGANVVLNLNGKTVSGVSGKDTIYVENGATLEISGDGEITNVAGKANIFNNGDVTIKGGTITHTGSYYAILNHGTMTIEDATVTSTAEGNSMVVNGYYNYTSTDERLGYVENKGIANPSMTIKGGTFTGDVQNCIYKGDDGSINNIFGGTFSGAAYCVLQNVNEMTIDGGDFTNKMSGSPVIYNIKYDDNIDKGQLEINDGNFTSADEDSPLFENLQDGTIVVNGGSYSSEPDEEFVADGLEFLLQDDNGRWEIDEEEPATVETTSETNPNTADPIVAFLGLGILFVLGLGATFAIWANSYRR